MIIRKEYAIPPMQILALDTSRNARRNLLWCFFWANRKAIRTEGCAPFTIEKVTTSAQTFTTEPGKILALTASLLDAIEVDMAVGKSVAFTIKIGGETVEIAFHKDLLSVSTRRTKEMEEEIIECLKDDLKRGKRRICASFFQRLGIREEQDGEKKYDLARGDRELGSEPASG
jgi:hypothetical protein